MVSSLLLTLFTLSATWTTALAHTIITYPGQRGHNLVTSGTIEPGTLSIQNDNDTLAFPYGMQWIYPCGGLPTSTNRSLWPITGGAIAVEPGHQAGHPSAFIYINMGFGNEPRNMSHPMLPVFQITSTTRETYNSGFCLPQVPLPANTTVKVGDNATIQVVETALHGAALYNCIDITFAEPHDVPIVNEENCRNSSDIGFNLVFTTTSLSGAVPTLSTSLSTLSLLLPLTVAVIATALWS